MDDMLALDYNDVQIYHTDNDGNVSEYWYNPNGPYNSDDEDSFDVRELPGYGLLPRDPGEYERDYHKAVLRHAIEHGDLS